MFKKFKVFISIALCLLITSVSAAGKEVNFGPLFDYTNRPDQNKKEITVLGPFFIYRTEDKHKEYGLRPLFYNEYDYKRDKHYLDIAYPFAGYRRHENNKAFNILFFINYNSRHRQSDVQRNFSIFPVFFSSFSENKNDNYLALFPLYGNIKNKFHKDRISFALFPLFFQTESDGETNTNILWPFIGYQKGQGVEGFKLWPLYGYKKRKKPYVDDKFVLWPFYVKREKQFYDERVRYVSYLPFYSELDSKDINQKSYLWPFFNKYTDRKNEFERIDAPWPVFNITRGKKEEKRFFPLFAKEVSGDDKDGYFLWPLYSYKVTDLDDYKISKKYYLLFLYKDVKEIPKNLSGRSSRRVDLWPVFSYHRDRKGNRQINVLSILEPFLPGNRQIENNYSAFWTLYEKKKLVTGQETTTILWNTYKSSKHGRNKIIKISPLIPLFEYSRNDNIKIYKFFGGIIDYKRINFVDSPELALLN
ncbi:MAG: hypothetical protein GWM89_07630 [Candidatus Dadabacteria bacterium]|nr:hypothetical protein [Candidatus Dadabacteria bacterium]NIX15542.1 hypothetical protein [Candidatus Dadabacteria bacterium]NIY22282.1 hypothetical protein [Candidatus Dadabacteria bacterium]